MASRNTQFRPMLAASIVTDNVTGSYKGLLCELTYPKVATPKIDGIRAIKRDGRLVSRKNIDIPNQHIQSVCRDLIPEGWDMELWIPGATYHDVESAVMSDGGAPNFRCMVLDWFQSDFPNEHYCGRILNVSATIDSHRDQFFGTAEHVKPTYVYSESDLIRYEETCVNKGWEGVCLRDPNGPYKFGRSTFNEQYLLKWKRRLDAEAVVVGFEELERNLNVATQDNLGLTKRSSHAENKVGAGILGAFICDHPTMGVFKVGTGLSNEQRQDFWNRRKQLLGRMLAYSYMPHGTRDKPRHPSFRGWRRDL